MALLLYGIVPFVAAEESATALWLNAMHVAEAAPIVGLLARAMEQDRGTAGAPVAARQGANT